MLVFAAIVIIALALVYLHDTRQTHHTILRNFPIIGHVRYFAETWGEYMRQYQYLPDWAERPFNRLERSWVYRSAKGRLEPDLIRFRECAELHFPQFPLPDAGGGAKILAGQADRHRRRPRRLPRALSGAAASSTSPACPTAR